MGARFAKLGDLFFLGGGGGGGGGLGLGGVMGLLVLELDGETRVNFFSDFTERFHVVVRNECRCEFRKFAVSPGVLGGAATMSADAAVASSISGDESFTTLLENVLLLFESEDTYLGKSGIGVGGGSVGGERDVSLRLGGHCCCCCFRKLMTEIETVA